MLRPFRLKRTIGPDYNMDLDDTFNTKKALRDLGHFSTPKYGLTPYPDQPMIDGIKSFQRRNGLREDGIMKSDGPTIKRLSGILTDRIRKEGRPALPRPDIHHTIKRDDDPLGVFWRGPAPNRPDIAPTLLQQAARRINRRSLVFGTGSDIGLGKANQPRDILALKRALSWSGHLPRNKDLGAENRLNDSLLTAVRRFQQDAGVKVDGWLRPGGETEKALDATITPQVQAFKTESAGEAPSESDDAPSASKDDADGPQIAMAPKPRRDGGSDILEGSGIMSPFKGGGGAASIGTGIAAQQVIRQHLQEKGFQTGEVPSPPEPGAIRPRTDIATPPPPTPGFEPPDDRDRPPTKTESPAQPVELPDLSQPLPKVEKPTIFVHPLPPEDLRGAMIIERKGNEATRKELERIRDFYEGQGWKHVAGGRYSERHEKVLDSRTKTKAGDEQSERHIKGHFGKLKGGHFTDLTFKTPDGRTVHVQTVDVDRNGKPTEREIDTAERIRRAVKNEHILLIPKGAQLKRNQRFRR